MTTIVTTIILTILAYELINFIVYVASGEDEDLLVKTSMGALYVVANIVILIARKVLVAQTRRKYNVYQFFGEVSKSKNPTKCDKWIENYYMTPEVASQFRMFDRGELVTEDFSIRLLRTGKELKSIPMKSEILTQEKINKGIPGMSADFIAKFKK